MMNDICVILTGGTIDKSYDPVTQINIMNDESVIPAYLHETIKIYPSIQFEEFSLLDSNDIDDAKLNRLASFILEQPCQKVLVTYGTDRMVEAAQYLSSRIANKCVILTGGIIPLKEYAMSDAGFNLGFALASLSHLDHGVFIAMNGKCFAPDQVRKNFDIARFEGI